MKTSGLTRIHVKDVPMAVVAEPLLLRLGIGLETQHFFLKSFTQDITGFLHFDYVVESGIDSTELRGLKTGRLVSTPGFWLWGNTLCPQVIYLFSSSMEALAFFELKRCWLQLDTSALFASLGVCPCRHQVRTLKARFPTAAIITAFPPDELGRICDCLVSLWLAEKVGTFSVQGAQILFQMGTGDGRIPSAIFERTTLTYDLFSRTISAGTGHKGKGQLRTYKPHKPFPSFLQQLAPQT